MVNSIFVCFYLSTLKFIFCLEKNLLTSVADLIPFRNGHFYFLKAPITIIFVYPLFCLSTKMGFIKTSEKNKKVM